MKLANVIPYAKGSQCDKRLSVCELAIACAWACSNRANDCNYTLSCVSNDAGESGGNGDSGRTNTGGISTGGITSACNPACSGAKPVCNDSAKTCVECTTDGNCAGAEPACNSTTNTCVECTKGRQLLGCDAGLRRRFEYVCSVHQGRELFGEYAFLQHHSEHLHSMPNFIRLHFSFGFRLRLGHLHRLQCGRRLHAHYWQDCLQVGDRKYRRGHRHRDLCSMHWNELFHLRSKQR